ncbi:MAG: hypothetical protein ACQETO_10500 [Pseudomonadota bacterium]
MTTEQSRKWERDDRDSPPSSASLSRPVSPTRFIIHFGYPKCASTTLQSGYWQRVCAENGFQYFGKRYDSRGRLRNHAEVFDFVNEIRVRSASNIRAHRERILKRHFGLNHATVLISIESFLFDVFRFRRHDGVLYVADIEHVITKLLALLAPDVQVLLVTRDQRQIIPSLFAEGYWTYRHIPELNTLSRFVWQITSDGMYSTIGDALDYDRVEAVLKEQVGSSNDILVARLEQMQSDMPGFFHSIHQFFNLRPVSLPSIRSNPRRAGDAWRVNEPGWIYRSMAFSAALIPVRLREKLRRGQIGQFATFAAGKRMAPAKLVRLSDGDMERIRKRYHLG